ncbi:MAG: hypothetical protein RR922_01580 [Clostridia bacterium]
MKVKKETLLIIASVVWLIAGFNVTKIGVICYANNISILNIMLSIVVFTLFGLMFYKMYKKHTKRIKGYKEEKQNVFKFFDIKSYCIMTFMISFGIWLRYSNIAPQSFIAFFYTGLGLALALAGALFGVEYIKSKKNR